VGRHQMPFELVFKRGGERPEEVRSWHLTTAAAVAEASREAAKQRRAGHLDVWLAYDLWDHSGSKAKRVRHNTVLQNPS
jgi:hypothetical protein